MAEQRLQDSARVTLDGSGAGRVSFGPSRPGTKWTVTGVSVQVSSNANEPVANIYRGAGASAGQFVSGTYNGSNDSDNGLSEVLWPGELLSVQWTGGDAGATATATYRGSITTE